MLAALYAGAKQALPEDVLGGRVEPPQEVRRCCWRSEPVSRMRRVRASIAVLSCSPVCAMVAGRFEPRCQRNTFATARHTLPEPLKDMRAWS